MTDRKAILQARDLHKTFRGDKPVKILRGIDLDVYPGDTVAICGRSGQGKTTLLHLLGTLDSPCSGTLQIAGQTSSFWNRSVLRRCHLGFVFQAFHLLDDQTAIDNVLMPVKLARYNTNRGSEAWVSAVALLSEMGLEERLDSPVRLLSGGEKQRVALARAMINRPSLILADEPSGNLDRETAAIIHSLLLGGVRQRGAALLVVTHDEELAALCSRRLNLHEGKIQEYTSE